jgi:chromosome segregation ATPase
MAGKVDSQKAKVAQLAKLEVHSEQELRKFSQTAEDQKTEYATRAKAELDATLASAKEQPETVERQMAELRQRMVAEAQHLTIQLSTAKGYTEQITANAIRSRNDTFEELREEYRLMGEEKSSALKQMHRETIEKIDQILKDWKIKHDAESDEIAGEIDALLAEKRAVFSDVTSDADSRKRELSALFTLHERELDDLLTHECHRCIEKKATIQQMLEKKEQLQQLLRLRIVDLRKDEDCMNRILGIKRPKILAPVVDSSCKTILDFGAARSETRGQTAVGVRTSSKLSG